MVDLNEPMRAKLNMLIHVIHILKKIKKKNILLHLPLHALGRISMTVDQRKTSSEHARPLRPGTCRVTPGKTMTSVTHAPSSLHA